MAMLGPKIGTRRIRSIETGERERRVGRLGGWTRGERKRPVLHMLRIDRLDGSLWGWPLPLGFMEQALVAIRP